MFCHSGYHQTPIQAKPHQPHPHLFLYTLKEYILLQNNWYWRISLKEAFRKGQEWPKPEYILHTEYHPRQNLFRMYIPVIRVYIPFVPWHPFRYSDTIDNISEYLFVRISVKKSYFQRPVIIKWRRPRIGQRKTAGNFFSTFYNSIIFSLVKNIPITHRLLEFTCFP